MPRGRIIIAIAVISSASSGCAPPVRLEQPPPLQSARWSGPPDLTSAEPTAISDSLASLLGSPELGHLTDEALARNQNIAIAAAQVESARALLKQARQAALPSLSASGGASRSLDLGSGKAFDFTSAFASLDATMEIDPFGGISGRKHAALARARAAELDRDATALAVETSVAEAYVLRAVIARRIEILDQTIGRAVELERVIRIRYEAGAATRVDLGLQSVRLLNLRTTRSNLIQALDQTRTALAGLTGAEAPSFDVAPANLDGLKIPALEPSSPASVLEARPDIRASEARIAAANGDVEQARAAFYPSLSLSAQGLLQDVTGGVLGKTVTAGASVLAPIFDRGRLQGGLRVAAADQVIAVEQYRLAVLGALTQVEDLRSAIAGADERAKLLDRIVDEARLTARLAQVQYIEGQEDLQTELDAEQWFGDAQDARVLGVQERLFAQIAMYQAMGGRARM